MKKEWYSQRDDRTQRLADTPLNELENFKVGIYICKDQLNDTDINLLTSLTINILARWCRNIFIDERNLGVIDKKKILKQIADIDPFCNVEIFSLKKSLVDAVLIIGNSIVDFDVPTFAIDSNGWISSIGFQKSHVSYTASNTDNIIGSAMSACFGNAELFKLCIYNEIPDPYSINYSIFDLATSSNPNNLLNPQIENNIDFGKVIQVGCGAVGSSLIYLLSKSNWQAEINLIDYDWIEISNCSSSLAFSANDAFNSQMKVDVCNTILQDTYITSRPYNIDFSQYVRDGIYDNFNSDLLLCLANERNIWNTIQENYPPIVLHATTTKNWGVNYGRHIPHKEWCIMCRFKDNIVLNRHLVCGDSVLKNDGAEIFGSLPFLSPASATVLLAQMIKLATNIQEDNSFLDINLKAVENGYINKMLQLKKEDCRTCNQQNFEISKQFNQGSKYWYLSE